jgi:hypothetical protein
MELPPEAMKALPGAAGSFVSMLFVRDVPWPRRLGMFLGGAALAYWGSPWASKWAALDAGFAGFMLGLLGMRLVAKVFEAWDQLELASLLRDILRQWLRLQPAPPPATPPEQQKEP